MICLTHGDWQARIARLGAELQSLRHVPGDEELIWSGDPAVWGQRSPLLFPFVGRLRGGGYRHGGRWWALPIHGFAAGAAFSVVAQDAHSVVLGLQARAGERPDYPFAFRLQLRYTLAADGLSVSVKLHNPSGHETLHFSLGAHPGFALPGALQDWSLAFNGGPDASVWRLADGLLARAPESLKLGPGPGALALNPDTFADDALVLRHSPFSSVSLVHRRTGPRLHLHTGGAPQLGLWAPAGGAPLVCIEPWWGHDDDPDSPPELAGKPQVMGVAPGGAWAWGWRVEPGVMVGRRGGVDLPCLP